MSQVALRPAKRLEVLVLVDNYASLLLEDEGPLKRPDLAEADQAISTDTLLAEHGLALLVGVTDAAGRERLILFDGGYSPVTIRHNMEMLRVDPARVEAVVVNSRNWNSYNPISFV